MKTTLKLIAILFFLGLFSCGDNETAVKEVLPQLETIKSFSSFSPTSAKVGAELTILGMGFGTDINKVSIQFADGATIKPKSVVDDKMIVVVPNSAISGKIKLTIGSNSTWMTSQQSFTLL